MNRFRDKKKQRISVSGLTLSVVFSAACFGLFLAGITGTREETQRKEQENLELLLDQSAAFCYALEGSYPESLAYLQEHYGINWETNRYLVDFETIGRNLPPDITVIPK